MKPQAQARTRDVGTGLPTHVGYPLRVQYGENAPVEVDGRVKAILLGLMRLEGDPQRLLTVVDALLREHAEMGLERETVRGVAFDWGSGWFNWDVQQGRRRQETQESEAA